MNLTAKDKTIQFLNCKILRNGAIINEDLWVCNKIIIDPEPVFYIEKKLADVKINCKGAIISPGFIDLQINGGFGIDFSANLDDVTKGIQTVAQGILTHGVTSFCPTLITSPPSTYQKIVPKIKKQNGSNKGAGILGIHLEGPFISKEKKGAHPVQYIKKVENGIKDFQETYGSLDDIAIITTAPELHPSNQVIKELVQKGITVSVGHSMGTLKDGERAVNSGATFITHLFNAMLPFHHRDPGLVGLLTSRKISEKGIYYGLIADGIHTHPAAIRIAYRSHPHGLVLVTDAMSAMGLKPGKYCIGEQKVEVTEDRAVVEGTDTLSGSIATMENCIRNFRDATGCSQVEALECATLHPAQVLNITNSKGTLDFGTDADFVLLNENLLVLSTYIAGECVWKRENA